MEIRLSEGAQRPEVVGILNRMHGRVVLLAVRLRATNDPDHVRGRAQLDDVFGSVPRHEGPAMANPVLPSPVVRMPGDAKTLVHASMSSIKW